LNGKVAAPVFYVYLSVKYKSAIVEGFSGVVFLILCAQITWRFSACKVFFYYFFCDAVSYCGKFIVYVVSCPV
jgi:hypothetical protein